MVHGERGPVEYDFVVRPGADPRDIALRVGGGGAPRLDGRGRLVVRTAAGDLVQRAPVVFQRDDRGRRLPITGRFVLRGRRLRLAVGAYDRSRTLVIDPVVEWATFAGGNAIDAAEKVRVLADGSILAAGSTLSTDFPTTVGAYDTTNAGNGDVWVTRLSADGTKRTTTSTRKNRLPGMSIPAGPSIPTGWNGSEPGPARRTGRTARLCRSSWTWTTY